MSEDNSTRDYAHRGTVTRRQLLQWVPGMAALAAVGPASPAFALTAPPEGPATSSLPTAESPALAVSVVDMPFRTTVEAIEECARRRASYGAQNATGTSALEKVLEGTSLVESRLGLGNWPLLDESEDPHLGHFTFPISPFNITADDGAQQFLLFSNNQVIANFRRGDYLEYIQRRMSDRAIWAIHEGRMGSAIVEIDRPLTEQKVDRVVRFLGYYGVKTIIWGNELNDPSTPWRDDLPALFDILTAANNSRRRYGLNDVDFSLPGLAYYGHGEYLQKMLRTLRDLQRQRFPSSPDLPVQRISDHYYGPVDGLLERIRLIRGIAAAEGITNLKYDLTEIGNPTLDGGAYRANDLHLAEGYIVQIACSAIASGQVDKITYYSLLDVTNDHSLMEISDGRLVKKPSYQAFLVAAKLMSRLKTLNVTEERDLVRVDGRRTDGINFQIVWSRVPDRSVWVDLPKSGARIFDTLGRELKEDKVGQIVLWARQIPSLAGPARILITQ